MIALSQRDLPYIVLTVDPMLQAYRSDKLSGVAAVVPASRTATSPATRWATSDDRRRWPPASAKAVGGGSSDSGSNGLMIVLIVVAAALVIGAIVLIIRRRRAGREAVELERY